MSPLPNIEAASDEPLYNIGVVERMTGISMATLRAWERRYDFPEATRTAGGHRLYSEKDVLRLRWVKRRIDGGMQTAQAIHALRHQEETGRFIMTEQDLSEEQPATRFMPPQNGRDYQTEERSTLPVFQGRLTDALSIKDIPAADEVLAGGLTVFSPEDLILKVIAPTLSQIGDLWESGNIGVATEHLATNYLRHRLLLWMLSGPPPQSRQPIVLACAPNEWHEGSLLILGALLRRRRWLTSYLGQAVPLPDLANFIQDIKPSLIINVAMTEQSALALVDWPEWMPEAAQNNRPIFCYGGRIFVQQPEWRLKMRGIYLGNTIEEGLMTAERLLT